jgi:DNA mismatch repair protein MutL
VSDERIVVLADEVIDRIAAGEVVERPASVVKELCENSFDAGARSVEVHLEEGGLGRISISDDGSGMGPLDTRRSILRHATSKLREAEDLFQVRTYGFRGEALSSIAAVSRMTITTRRSTDQAGTRLRVEGGTVLESGAAGCPTGTTIDVQELFFNTPARQKFMRAPATEQAHAVEAAQRVVLGVSSGALVVTAGERRLLDVPGDGDPAARIRAALGQRVGELHPFEQAVGQVRVHGFVATSELDRGDGRGLWIFVNGRFVRDRMLQRALLDGFGNTVERGRYPTAVVYVELPPAAVDVNVHPQKLEVRFVEGAPVFRALVSGVAGVLLRAPRRPTAYAVRSSPSPTVRELVPAYEAPPVEPDLAWTPGGFFGRLVPLGHALDTYVVCQGQEALVLIDHHAARQRVAVARLQAELGHGGVQRQQLLFPEAVELSPRLAAYVHERAPELTRLGIDVEPVGPNRFVVRALPAALAGCSPASLVPDVLARLAEDADEAHLLAACARHAGTAELSRDQLRALLHALDQVDFTVDGPEAKRVYRVIDREELARLFGR